MVAIRKIILAALSVPILVGIAYAASDWLKGNSEQGLKTLARASFFSDSSMLLTVILRCSASNNQRRPWQDASVPDSATMVAASQRDGGRYGKALEKSP